MAIDTRHQAIAYTGFRYDFGGPRQKETMTSEENIVRFLHVATLRIRTRQTVIQRYQQAGYVSPWLADPDERRTTLTRRNREYYVQFVTSRRRRFATIWERPSVQPKL